LHFDDGFLHFLHIFSFIGYGFFLVGMIVELIVYLRLRKNHQNFLVFTLVEGVGVDPPPSPSKRRVIQINIS
jgi:hypothetical protein